MRFQNIFHLIMNVSQIFIIYVSQSGHAMLWRKITWNFPFCKLLEIYFLQGLLLFWICSRKFMLLGHTESPIPKNVTRQAIGQGGIMFTQIEFDNMRLSSYICLHFRWYIRYHKWVYTLNAIDRIFESITWRNYLRRAKLYILAFH